MAQSSEPKPTAPSPAIVAALLVSAVMLVVLGTILPEMMEFSGLERWLMSGVFYLAAAGDVAIALWFRSKSRKARATAASGGAIQRQ